jgi:hypothetical protein
MKIDRQRQRVYNWENLNIAPKDRTPVRFENIKHIVDFVWSSQGLEYPPQVILIPKQNHNCGDATRTTVRFREETQTWIILHELSHSMSSLCDDRSNQHGALFMGLYCQLLSKYLNMDFAELIKSATDFGLRVKPDAKPAFLED